MKKYKTVKFLFSLCLVVQTLTLICYGNSNRFCGGSFDGYAMLSFMQSDTGDSGISNQCYGGGSFDGYAMLSFMQSDTGDSGVSNQCYSGGSFDGYAMLSFMQSDTGDSGVSNQCYGGGSFDGYAMLSFMQSDTGDSVSTNKCYSGGSYDGYDAKHFDYPIPFVEITNAPYFRLFSQTTAEISGTNNFNVLGQLGWLNNRFHGVTNWFDQGFDVEVIGLAEGSNTITVLAPNYLGIFAKDSVIIYRETFDDVHPFIKITNAPSEVNYNISSTEICGTNLNIAGNLGWTNSLTCESGNFQISNFHFQVSNINLDHGDNLIEIFGTNIYNHFTNDFVTIHRETFDDVHPFIKITNAPSEVNYNISSAEISGTNLNIAGEMWWTNSLTGESGNFQISNFHFQVSNINLEHGDNLIEIFGTNIYNHFTNDFVTIHRETFAEVHPFIKITNAPPTVNYNISSTKISGTNLNIAGEMWWTNSLTGGSGTIPISNFYFQVSIDHGDNLIEIFGTNVYGHSTNSVVSIHRETFDEVYPFIDITNVDHIVAYNISSTEICGTNLNIAGNLGWTNSLTGESGNFQISNFHFQVSNINLEHGDNLIKIFGTNIYNHFTNDFVTIHRETFAEVHPFIDITNENATVTYSVTSYTIGGTNNANVVGGLKWTNSLSGEFGDTQISNLKFQISNLKLNPGDNLITVSGTNVYGHSTNSVVSIRRKTLIESEPQIATNALIFPSANSELFEGDLTNIIWDVEKITDDLDGTNLTITKISVHYASTTNEEFIVTNNIENLLGEIPFNVYAWPESYVIKFEVVDSSFLTNSRIFWDNEFAIVPEPIGILLFEFTAIACVFFTRKYKAQWIF